MPSSDWSVVWGDVLGVIVPAVCGNWFERD
jgi:hypothetical protein